VQCTNAGVVCALLESPLWLWRPPPTTVSGFHTSSDHLISKPASHARHNIIQGLQLHGAPGVTDGNAAITGDARSRRDILKQSATAIIGAAAAVLNPSSTSATGVVDVTADGDARRSYAQQFSTLFVEALAGRLIVPPVVRTLLHAQDPKRVKSWVDVWRVVGTLRALSQLIGRPQSLLDQKTSKRLFGFWTITPLMPSLRTISSGV